MNVPRKALCVALLCAAAGADAAESLRLEADARLRHEHVEDDAFARGADADTLRLRLGVRAEFGRGWSGLLEGEGIAASDNDYNSGANGNTAYPPVIDPTGAEFNQAWIAWRGERIGATLGRQRLLLDNQRFVGASGWRQNEQTFDAVALEATPRDVLTLRYAWLDRAHRVNGDDAVDPLARERALSTHLFNFAYKRDAQQWTGYAYLHDDRDVAAASTATYGARWTGSAKRGALTWGWSAELAQQRDHADNPQDFGHAYRLLEPTLSARGVAYKLGWERLGGNGRHALQTPLATLHAFNGWADKFLVTPPDGLDDRYVGASGKVKDIVWTALWHDYHADRGGDRYGREWDVSLSRPFGKRFNGLIKFAEYRSDGFARDTRKLWMQVEFKDGWGSKR